MIGLQPPAERNVGEHVVRRDDIERGEPGDAGGTVERHAKADAGAPVVTGNAEARKTQ